MSTSLPYLRTSRLRSFLIALAAGVVVASCAAAPASAGRVIVIPTISGSGSLAGGTPCTAGPVPNGVVSGCPATIAGASGFPPIIGVVALTALPQPTPANHWTFTRWEGCPIPQGNQCTMIDASLGESTFVPRAVFTDGLGPTVAEPTVTYSTTTDRTVTLNWGANEPVVGFACSLDNAAFGSCPNGAQTLTLAEGGHTFRVRGTDISGNLGAISTAASFRILDTALVSGPADFSSVKSPNFVFSSLTGTAFECSVDSVALADCGPKSLTDNRGSKAFANLSDGIHTFRVRAKDGPADFDRVPVVRTWTVDSVLPVATLDGNAGPGEGALQAVNKETFKFTSNEISTFECRLDSAAFAPCATDFLVEQLTAGAHRFEVRAIDRAGNVGAVAVRNWSVAAADSDNDGFNALIDCNDGDPGIRPGAVEILDNGIDENCDGVNGVTPATPTTPAVVQNVKPAATEQIIITLAFFSAAGKTTTKFTTLQIKNVPLGATVQVTCKGKGCPKGLTGKGFTKKNAFGTVTLAKFIKKALRAGDTITVAVSKPDAISAIKILKVRASKKPLITTKCQPPGSKSPVAC